MKLFPGTIGLRVPPDAPTSQADPSNGLRSRRPRRTRLARPSRLVAAAAALALPIALVLPAATAQAKPPVGQGFTVTPSDLAFILKQIKIAERHSRAIAGTEPTAAPNPNPTTDPNYCAALLGPGRDQIPDKLAPYGLRTVDGSCNNLIPGRERFGAADQTMPRRATAVLRDAETSPPAFGPPVATSYRQKKGSVFDSRPRMISNLISDQTSTNPAAVAAAGFPVRTQGNPGLFPCTTEPGPDGTGGVPAGCVPKYKTLFIPNVSTDVGLTPPYNSLFTFFGQFFDHGLDQAVKGGGTVFVPLQADDPLIPGADHVLGTADDLPADQRFMVLTRAQNQPGPDGILGDRNPTTATGTPCTALNTPAGCDESADDLQEATNTDSPWIDQSQTYSSHPAHQVFLREYVDNVLGRPVSTGALLGGSGARTSGLATWADVKSQAATLLGLRLADADALSVPMIATDPYGKFIPGPLRGLPQYVTATGLVEGDTAAPVAVPANVRTFNTPFLTDITDNAVPRPGFTPDADSVVTPSLTPCAQPGVPAGCVNQYDDEMLDLHFVAGDGRANENIALSSIHQVFHSEHNRLVSDIQDVLTSDTTPSGVAALTQWQDPNGASGWNGERIFQAARFVTEMEYQHLVFGEFARKMAPAIPVFRTYNPDINAAIRAEFAHAVYRLGHSMLDEVVARTRNGKDNSIPLLQAFLNPPEYFNGGPTDGEPSPESAAGSILMGASDQVGNELDEFMTDTLRNNLLGLPLDLATLNLTRARETGVPPLNGFRRQLFAATNDSHLRPYQSWTDFGQGIKHPGSLVNFVAAYGTHPTILTDVGPDGVLVDDPGTPADESADNGPATLASRRLAAQRIVDPAVGEQHAPADAADFMFGTNAWADDASGATTTGVDDIDLWVGGLAEATEINGGLLGSSFDVVFQDQMTDLQDGDRLYYLARTPGMNLGTQLEGNSFAELILRNTVGTDSLSADAFGTSDCKFQLKDLDGTAAGFDAFGATIADDPLTVCDESKLLLRMPDGTIQYRQSNSVDPPGINKQAVFNGTTDPDRVWGGNGNDTFWGLGGNDVIEGGGGIDNVLGGEGNDVITDLAGADILKGGPGNDAVDGGPDNDILLGGDGQDVLNGGANDNQDFGGPGNDFVIGGQGADAVQGDGGDDWLEGGSGQDLLTGDHGSPFFDDPGQVTPGNEVMIGQSGDDYVGEGGDDLMASNAAPIDTFIGSAGFDWAFHQFDTVAAHDDLTVAPGVQLPPGVGSDRWQETEAVSGSAMDDVIRGDDVVPRTLGGAGSSGCDVLDQAGVDRISGLGALLPHPLTGDPVPVVASSAAHYCPISGPVWGEGNILIGGAGSDTIRGGGGDDVIDGDKALSVRISVRDDLGNEIGSTDLLEHTYQVGNPHTLQADVFAGVIDPGNLVTVREIVAPSPQDAATSVDTAVFSEPEGHYTVTTVPAGAALGAPGSTTTVRHDNGGADGTDTLRNIEKLQFAPSPGPAAPTGVTAVAGDSSATVSWTAPATGVGSPITGYSVRVIGANGAQVGALRPAAAAADQHSVLVTGLANGTPVRFQVAAVDANGTGAFSAPSAAVTPDLPPGAPGIGAVTVGSGTATVRWTAPASNGGSPITRYSVQLFDGADNPVGTARPAAANATSLVVTGLVNGSSYTYTVTATNSTGDGPASANSGLFTPHLSGPGFTGLTPTRVMDTRSGTGVAKGRIGAGGQVTLTVPGLPASATAVVLNVTAIRPSASGYLTVFPAGTTRPTTSSLNFVAGQTVPNLVMVKVGTGGKVTLYNSAGTVDVIADLAGYYSTGGAGLVGETPRRVMNTATGTGAAQAKVAAGGEVTLTIPNLPAGARSVVLNVTATGPSAAGYLTVYPTGSARPTTSNLNFVAGQTVSNLVVVNVGSGGKVTFFNSAGTVDVIADLSGSYSVNRGDGFTGLAPRRVLDTRLGTGAARAKVAAGAEVTLTVPGLPAGTTSVVLNVTATNPTATGFLTVYPTGAARPATTSVSFAKGRTVPDLVVVNVGPGGKVTLYNGSGTVDVIADLAGYYRP